MIKLGKPFESELSCMKHTYEYSLNCPIDSLTDFIKQSYNTPVVAVGSGGSLTAAHMFVLLQQECGALSKAVTPYELISLARVVSEYNAIILTAGGRNPDILSAFKLLSLYEPQQLLAFCMKKQSPLYGLTEKYRFSKYLGLEIPCGKDGFLATNSLIATFTVLIRAFNEVLPQICKLPEDLMFLKKCFDEHYDIQPLFDKETLIVLYGGWGQPAAFDCESKFTEAALGNIQIADYRNFGHGRHHWLAKRGKLSGIIALATPSEAEIAEKTLSIIPKSIPRLLINTNYQGPAASLDLLIKVFYLVNAFGKSRGIDPGDPKVPAFGRKIYNLRYPYLKSNIKSKKSYEEIAVIRKSKCSSPKCIDSASLDFWKKAYRDYTHLINKTVFGAIILDYDGTICDPHERYLGVSDGIKSELLRLLDNGIIIGIATGRGSSVKSDLQDFVPEEYWNKVLIGYYNGGDIGYLGDEKHPLKNIPVNSKLEALMKQLQENCLLIKYAKLDCRANQITIQPLSIKHWYLCKCWINEITAKNNYEGIKLVESSHSIDIILHTSSKLNLLNVCKDKLRSVGITDNILCIGDKGKWPGNDFEILSSSFSLCVDETSCDPKSCWNLVRAGIKGAQAAHYYLKAITCYEKGTFIFSTKALYEQMKM